MKASEGRSNFKLRDLLTVPMQRVLKYHLLLKVIISCVAATAVMCLKHLNICCNLSSFG